MYDLRYTDLSLSSYMCMWVWVRIMYLLLNFPNDSPFSCKTNSPSFDENSKDFYTLAVVNSSYMRLEDLSTEGSSKIDGFSPRKFKTGEFVLRSSALNWCNLWICCIFYIGLNAFFNKDWIFLIRIEYLKINKITFICLKNNL